VLPVLRLFSFDIALTGFVLRMQFETVRTDVRQCHKSDGIVPYCSIQSRLPLHAVSIY